MNKHTIIAADGSEPSEMLSDATGRLDAGIPFEFFKSGDEQWDKFAEVVVKAAILFLVFLVVVFVGFLVYLGLR